MGMATAEYSMKRARWWVLLFCLGFGDNYPVIYDIVCSGGAHITGARGANQWCEVLDDNGDAVKTGPTVAWHGNGLVSYVGALKNNRKTGINKFF